jgi:co-chaperonin GroES (HSP10)
MKVKPIGSRLLIKEKKPSEFFPGTKIVKTSTKKEYVADVIAVGENVKFINVGDTVKYSEDARLIPMRHNQEEHFLISNDMIFAIISDE